MAYSVFGSVDDFLIVAINNLNSEFMDDVIMTITDRWFFIGVVLCTFFYMFHLHKRPKAILYCILLLVAVGCSDFLCASILRPAVQQLRPTNPDNPIHSMLHIVNGYTGGRYGFPSCHAANAFAIAMFSSLCVRRRWFTIVITVWALAECYTRLYLGVHYPSDILFGIAIGCLMAFIVYRLSIIIPRAWQRPAVSAGGQFRISLLGITLPSWQSLREKLTW